MSQPNTLRQHVVNGPVRTCGTVTCWIQYFSVESDWGRLFQFIYGSNVCRVLPRSQPVQIVVNTFDRDVLWRIFLFWNGRVQPFRRFEKYLVAPVVYNLPVNTVKPCHLSYEYVGRHFLIEFVFYLVGIIWIRACISHSPTCWLAIPSSSLCRV